MRLPPLRSRRTAPRRTGLALALVPAMALGAAAQVPVQELIGSPWPPDSHFGRALAATPERLAVGMTGPVAQSLTPGAVSVFLREGPHHVREARLVAPDGEPDDEFGWALDLGETTLAVGARRHDAALGAVYLYERGALGWVFAQELQAPDGADADRFGESVALDGDTLAVGAPGHDSAAGGAGAVYVFRRSAGLWSFAVKLVANDAQPFDLLGQTVDVSGERVAAGAVQESSITQWNGAVYVWRRVVDELWAQEAKLVPGDVGGSDFFGSALALQGDVLVGASPTHNGPGTSNQGAVYTFVRGSTGWEEVQALAPVITGSLPAQAFFGTSLALEGTRLVVGSRLDRAWLFEVSGAGFTGAGRLVSRHDVGVAVTNGTASAVALRAGLAFLGTPDASHWKPADGCVRVFAVGD